MTCTYALMLSNVCVVFLFWRSKVTWGHFRFGARKLQEFLFPQLGIVEFLNLKLEQCIFPKYMYISLIRIKGHKGVKRSNLFSIGPKILNISNCKNKNVVVFYMDREAKVSTVTSSSDLPIRAQWSKKVKI